ncbi:MAG TPA: hypothetical protein VMB80_02540 [Candidatus Acidoferrum sp.]|nr:hypothetical protein [Candidatus Acidoferrum sp.]
MNESESTGAKLTLVAVLGFWGLCCFSSAGTVIRSTTIRPAQFNLTDISAVELVFTEEHDALLPVLKVHTFSSTAAPGKDLLYINGTWTDLKEHGFLLNTFERGGQLYAVFQGQASDEITIQKVQPSGGLVSTGNIEGELIKLSPPGCLNNLLPVQERNSSYYLLTGRWEFPINPGEFLFDLASGGHGVYYVKPFMTEVQDGKPGKPQKLSYGGTRDETFYVKRVCQSGDWVHFLGFRQAERRAWGPREIEATPVILHHVAYDLKNRKVIQTSPIYTNSPRSEADGNIWYRYDYGDFSMDAEGKDVFVAFVWAKFSHPANQSFTEEKHIESNILYWDCRQNQAGQVEKITGGFLPVVRADSLGDVHLFYVNTNANLMHKAKRNGVWQKEDVLVNRVEAKPYFGTIAAAFDKNDNLHVVYPLNGNLVYAVAKVD